MPLKIIWRPNYDICRAKFFLKLSLQNLRSKINSTLILKISGKNIETLLSSINLNGEKNVRISRTEIWAILFILCDYLTTKSTVK